MDDATSRALCDLADLTLQRIEQFEGRPVEALALQTQIDAKVYELAAERGWSRPE